MSLTLGFPISRLYTRYVYFDMSLARENRKDESSESEGSEAGRSQVAGVRQGPDVSGFWEPERVRLCRKSLRDLSFFRSITQGKGRYLVRLPTNVTMHSDATDVGYGETFGYD